MSITTTPTNRVGVRIDVQLDGSVVVGPVDGSHAYSILLTPAQLRALALDFWGVAEWLQPEVSLLPAPTAASDREVKPWN